MSIGLLPQLATLMLHVVNVQCKSLSGVLIAANLALALALYVSSGVANCQEPDTQPQLRGLAEFQSLSVTRLSQTTQLVPSCHSMGIKCFEVKIQNNSSEIVTIDADKAQAEVAGESIRASSLTELIRSLGCGLSLADKGLLSAVSLVSLGLAGPLLYDFISTNPYPKVALGTDGIRHSIEIQRLGRRLLLPNDETTGCLCFPLKTSVTPAKIYIPVHSVTSSGRVSLDTTR